MNDQTEEQSLDRTRLIDYHVRFYLVRIMLSIFLILITVLIFFKLFREFGKTQKIIVNLTEADKEKLQKTLEQIIPINAQNQNIPNQQSDENLRKLQEKFPEFSIDSFLSKAEEIFDAVFNGFANSHHHILKSLLTEDLYEDFAAQIQKREQKDFRQELLIKHKQTKLEKIQFLAEKVRIFVTFDISQMSAMVNIDGVSFDNPRRLYRDVIHKWIFERNYKKENWVVSKTSAFEA